MPDDEVTPAAEPAKTEPVKSGASFPANTPVAEMTPEQQAAYWQDKARKHEDRNKAVGLTPEQARELRDKASRADALDYELASEKDKAVADARKASEEEAAAKFRPRLVAAEFRASAAGRIEPDRLATILEPLDMSRFIDDSGDVDTAKVSAYIDGIEPARGIHQPARGPSTSGLGSRASAATASVASGRELYRAQRSKP